MNPHEVAQSWVLLDFTCAGAPVVRPEPWIQSVVVLGWGFGLRYEGKLGYPWTKHLSYDYTGVFIALGWGSNS